MNRISGHVVHQLVASVSDRAQRTIAEAGWVVRPTSTVLLAATGVTDAAAMHCITYLLSGHASLAGSSSRMLRRAAAGTLALALALLPGAVPALARAQQVVVAGTDDRFFGVPASVVVADGWTQIRGLPLSGTFAFSGAAVTLAGSETQLVDAKVDANGDGRSWGHVTYTDAATGVTCTGIIQGLLIRGLITATVVAPCSDGGLLKGTLHDTLTLPPHQAPPREVRSNFNGTLLIPS